MPSENEKYCHFPELEFWPPISGETIVQTELEAERERLAFSFRRATIKTANN